MAIPYLYDYVKNAIDHNANVDILKQNLQESGYSVAEIESTITQLTEKSTTETEINLKKDVRNVRTATLGIFFLAAFNIFTAFQLTGVILVLDNGMSKAGAMPFAIINTIPLAAAAAVLHSIIGIVMFYSGIKLRTRSVFGFNMALSSLFFNMLAGIVLTYLSYFLLSKITSLPRLYL